MISYLEILIMISAFLLICMLYYIFIKYHKSIFLKRKKKLDLRKLCIQEYGEEFGDLYDKLNRGESIGGYYDTIIFITKINKVENKYSLK